MRFSILGLFIAAAIFAPNLLFALLPPRQIPEGLKSAGLLFTVCERIGQAACMLILIFSGADWKVNSVHVWFVLMTASILIYEGLWIRYFTQGREFSLLFGPLCGIPIPMAVFPVLAFGFAAVWVGSIWLGMAVAVFAIGHFANSWATYKSL